MSALDVARRDLLAARRSRSLWAVATLLALLGALLAYGMEGYRTTPAEHVGEVFRTLSLLVALVVPLVAMVASYTSVAGKRESGGIKFLLGVPNARRDVLLGTLASRVTVVSAGVLFMFVAAASVARARHGVLPLGTVAGLAALSVVYAAVFVGVGVALSSSVAARSRAIGAAVGAYFGLVILYVVPGIRVGALARWVHHTMLGFEANPDLYGAVTYTSPFVAYRKATNLLFPPELQRDVFRRSAEAGADLPAYLTDEFSLVVFAAWLVVPLAVGHRQFARAELE